MISHLSRAIECHLRSALDRKSTMSFREIASQTSVRRVSMTFRWVNNSMSFRRIAHVCVRGKEEVACAFSAAVNESETYLKGALVFCLQLKHTGEDYVTISTRQCHRLEMKRIWCSGIISFVPRLTWILCENWRRLCRSRICSSSIWLVKDDDIPLALFVVIVVVQWWWLVDDSWCNEHWRSSTKSKGKWMQCTVHWCIVLAYLLAREEDSWRRWHSHKCNRGYRVDWRDCRCDWEVSGETVQLKGPTDVLGWSVESLHILLAAAVEHTHPHSQTCTVWMPHRSIELSRGISDRCDWWSCAPTAIVADSTGTVRWPRSFQCSEIICRVHSTRWDSASTDGSRVERRVRVEKWTPSRSQSDAGLHVRTMPRFLPTSYKKQCRAMPNARQRSTYESVFAVGVRIALRSNARFAAIALFGELSWNRWHQQGLILSERLVRMTEHDRFR